MKTGLVFLATLLLTVVGAVPAAEATTPTPELPGASVDADPSPEPSSTPVDTTPSPKPSSTPVDTTPSPKPSSAPVDTTPSPKPSSTPVDTTPSPKPSSTPVDTDPSLSEMNASGDHTMGSTIPSGDPASGARTQFTPALAVSGVLGQDVSGWQVNVNWAQQWSLGSRFAYVKATEGTDYRSSQFTQQYNGSAAVGMVRGAYHFATPNTSDGASQARYFHANGGGWSPDGRTLPPLLDIEYATDGSGTCWGLSPAQMTSWISSFISTLRALTGVNPAIYSTANWWNQCTGSNNTFGAYPLFVARYGTSTPGALPASWVSWTMWQHQAAGTFAGDQDIFNGTVTQLRQLALGAQVHPPIGHYDSATVASGSPFTITGWAFDQTNLAATVTIRITWNTPAGVSTTTIAANGSRPDVGAAYPGVGNAHGFTARAAWSGSGQYGACVTVLAIPGDRAGNASLGCKTAFFSPASATAPTAQRLAGADRFATAVAISAYAFPKGRVPVAYIASGLNFPDALSAAPAAGAQGGPVLLSTPGSVPSATLAELKRLAPGRIVVVGGTAAISAAAYKQLAALRFPIVRIGGSDRFETSRSVASYAFPSASTAYIASGAGFADALSAAPVAAKARQPLVLVTGGTLDGGTRSYLSGRGVRTLNIIGGTSIINSAFQSQASSAGFAVKRIAGSDRFATSAAVTASAFAANGARTVFLASGYAWQDALVAAAAAGAGKAPLMLAASTCVPRVIGNQMVRLGTTALKIAGGTSVLSADVNTLAVCY